MTKFSDTLPTGRALAKGDNVVSINGQFQLIQQEDGNLVAYNGQSPLWASLTFNQPVKQCTMQSDGNLVITDFNDAPLWASQTGGFTGAFLRVQDDGNVVIYTPDGTAIADTQHHQSPVLTGPNTRG